jgi:hypothetical protein
MYRMAKFTRKTTIRLARIVMPLGKERNGSLASEPASTLPPIVGKVFHFHIPLAMFGAALARHRQRPTPPKVTKDKPKKSLIRFRIPLARIEMPLDLFPRKK